jgi:hypothetical protein
MEQAMNPTDADIPAVKRAPGRPRREFRRPALNLRVEPELRARIVALAEQNGRSITQETEALLQKAVNGIDRGGAPAVMPGPLANRRLPFDALVDALGRILGREEAALSLVMGHLMGDARYLYEHKITERSWLANPKAFSHAKESINALLQLIDPGKHPSLVAEARRYLSGRDDELSLAQMDAVCTAADIAFGWDVVTDPRWAPIIREWLDPVIGLLRQRIPEGKQPSNPTAEGKTEDGS